MTMDMAEASDVDSRENTTHLSREPSSSCWYGEGQSQRRILLTEGDEDGGSVSEMTLLQRDESQIGACESCCRPNFFRQRSSHSVENVNGQMFLSFNVDNGLERSVPGSISAAIVLKTLFYIVVWHTFSTCLTLYNKTLLGDKLGKFPAPLLMSTFHFVLQAVLSKTILYFHKGGSDSDMRITWKDYF